MLYALAAAAGFIASIHLWPKLRQLAFGLQSEADRLRAKARDLEARLRG